MIRSKVDYERYLAADMAELGCSWWSLSDILFHRIWRFQRALRRVEYYTNCRPKSVLVPILRLLLRRRGAKLGFSIPPNVFGPGLSIAHAGTIVVNRAARVGAYCRLHVAVNIGTTAGGTTDAPRIGDHCYISPGAKLFGAIELGDNVIIGANAVVNRSCPDGNVTLVGIPAKPVEHDSGPIDV